MNLKKGLKNLGIILAIISIILLIFSKTYRNSLFGVLFVLLALILTQADKWVFSKKSSKKKRYNSCSKCGKYIGEPTFWGTKIFFTFFKVYCDKCLKDKK